MGCGSNFRCKFKKTGHGPLSRWADFFKWSYPNGLYLDSSIVIENLLINILLQAHVLIFSIFLIFGLFFNFFCKNLPVLFLV
jgi:hypothetical protein